MTGRKGERLAVTYRAGKVPGERSPLAFTFPVAKGERLAVTHCARVTTGPANATTTSATSASHPPMHSPKDSSDEEAETDAPPAAISPAVEMLRLVAEIVGRLERILTDYLVEREATR